MPHMPIDIMPLMTPQRILGAMLWSVAHGELPDDLVFLVDNLGLDVKSQLHPHLSDWIGMVQTSDLEPEQRQALVEQLQAHLQFMLQEQRDLGVSGPAGSDV